MTDQPESYSVARALHGHRTDSKILIIFLASAVIAFALLWLGSEVLEGDTFAIDRSILLGLRITADVGHPIGPSWLVYSMIDATALGSVTVLTLVTIMVVGYLVATRRRTAAVFVSVAVIGDALLSSALKSLFFRARPDVVPHLVHVSSASFPSGHAMNSAVVYLTLATLLARTEPNERVRVYLLVVAISLALLVGVSRVYLGVHWPSDVIAGWSVGAIWAVLCSLVGKSLLRHRTIESGTPED